MLVISAALNEARLAGVLTFLDTGGAGKVQIYGGTRPALGGAPPAAVLVELPLAHPAGEVDDGVLTLTPTAEALVASSGTATWARVRNGAGEIAFDCDVSATGGSGEITLPLVDLYAGGYSRLVSGVLG